MVVSRVRDLRPVGTGVGRGKSERDTGTCVCVSDRKELGV